jgi:hypothetical protein
MKRTMGAMLAGVLLLFGTALPGFALGGPREAPGAFAHQEFNRSHGFPRMGFHHGLQGHRGFRVGHAFHGHRGPGANIFIAPPLWGLPTVIEPPVVVQQAPPVYIQPESPPLSGYWYYCQEPQGYYPYVTTCPGGWTTVVPPSSSP